jgi:hypothetical protein
VTDPSVEEGPPPPAVSLVLDIGPGAGALLVETPSELEGTEIHIVAACARTPTHAVVRRWPSLTRHQYAALFPEVLPGLYSILGSDGSSLTQVRIDEGHVATARVVETWH